MWTEEQAGHLSSYLRLQPCQPAPQPGYAGIRVHRYLRGTGVSNRWPGGRPLWGLIPASPPVLSEAELTQ